MELNIEKIIELYGENSVYILKENIDEISKNLGFLEMLGFEDTLDILECYPYLFLKEPSVFQEKVKGLMQKLGVESIEKLSNNMSLWGDICD